MTMTQASTIEQVERAEVLVSLDERKARIYAAVNTAALTIGAELIAAKAEHPREFTAWVEAECPWGIDSAERIMAVTRAFATCDPEVRGALPNPYSTLFVLTRLPTERLALAIETGRVNPDMTYRDAKELLGEVRDVAERKPAEPAEPRIAPDVLARELLRFPREQLSEHGARQLRRWLG